MHTLLEILRDFCLDSRLQVNVNKTKMEVCTHQLAQPRHIEYVHSFTYLRIDIPADHKWWQCVQRRLDTKWGKYYQFENEYKHTDTQNGEIRGMLFHA